MNYDANRTFYALLALLKIQSVPRAQKLKMCKISKGPVATLGAEFWTLNTDIVERLAAFDGKVLRRMFGGIKVNGDWRQRYDVELMELFGDLSK